MKLENIYEGLVVKSYRQLCELLEIEITGGNSKKAQLKELERFVKYHKEGNKFIVDEVYSEPLEKIDRRAMTNKLRSGTSNHRWKDYENLNIPIELMNNYGIYKITLKDDIYIGSTIVGFRRRFQQHYQGHEELMKHTYKLLQQGGVFEILYDMTGVEDEDLVRMVEDEFIKDFLLNPNWNVINKKSSAKSYKKTYKKKKRSIRIDEDKLYDAIQLLAKHGLIDKEGVDM